MLPVSNLLINVAFIGLALFFNEPEEPGGYTNLDLLPFAPVIIFSMGMGFLLGLYYLIKLLVIKNYSEGRATLFNLALSFSALLFGCLFWFSL